MTTLLVIVLVFVMVLGAKVVDIIALVDIVVHLVTGGVFVLRIVLEMVTVVFAASEPLTSPRIPKRNIENFIIFDSIQVRRRSGEGMMAIYRFLHLFVYRYRLEGVAVSHYER